MAQQEPLTGIRWLDPWFEPWGAVGEPVHASWKSRPLHEALNEADAEGGHECPPFVKFVAQEELPAGEAYETHIFRTANCPARENLHDFFNGLCWIAFPRSKRVLNRLQAQAIEAGSTGGERGPVRDAITVFDENGALLQAPPELWEALLARQWRRLFVELRPLWREARLVIFGHALLEKLVHPRKDLTAHVWRANVTATSQAGWDAELAAQLTAGRLAEKPFTPLPVMGIPGWCPDNRDFSFYDDSLVFRPAGRQKQT